MRIASGIELIEETPGTGPAAKKGGTVIYNLRIHLNRGDEVPLNEEPIKLGLPASQVRGQGDRWLVDHRTVLGKPGVIAGVERTLLGMRPGGYRKVRVSPHLAYRERGVPGLIGAKAVLVIELWLSEAQGAAC